MNKIGVFKSLVLVEELKDHFKSECNTISPKDWAAKLIAGDYDDEYFKEENIIIEEADLPNVPHSASVSKNFSADIDFAIELYSNIKLDTLSANDGRLWTYLSLRKYRDYIYSRYKCNETKTIGTMLGYFFFTGASANSLASHPIAKLWWGVHKTVDNSLDDPYKYSRIMFSHSQVLFDVIERAAIVSNETLTRSYLEVMERFPGKLDKVSRNLSPMILNHLSNHSIEILSKSQIDDLLNQFIEFLKSQKRI